jgi:hypothetical protein
MGFKKLRPWWPDSRNGAPEKPGQFNTEFSHPFVLRRFL